MQVKDLVGILHPKAVLDLSIMDGKTCKCFGYKLDKLPKKYLNYYIGYMCPGDTKYSYGSKTFLVKENIMTCLLLDIYKNELEANQAISSH